MFSLHLSVRLSEGCTLRPKCGEATSRVVIRHRTMRHITQLITALSAMICVSASLAGQAHKTGRPISIEDQFAFSQLSSPVLAPGGSSVFFVVEQTDYEAGQSRFQIMQQPLPDGPVAPITAAEHDSWQPVVSEDGRSLYFLSDRASGEPQLWQKMLDKDSEAAQVTAVAGGIDDINFSSDQTKLLFVRGDEDTREPLVPGSQPWVIDRLSFKRDYEGYVTHLRDHIYLYDLRSKKLRQLTFGQFDDSEPAWSPDDRQVAFVSNRNADGTYDSDIWVVDVSTPDEPIKITKNKGADSSPQWHPDGKSIFTLSAKADSYDNYAVSHLSRVDVETGEQAWLTEELDRNIFMPLIPAAGHAIYFVVEDRGQQQIARLDWESRDLFRLVSGPQVVTDFGVGDDGQMVFVSTTSDEPGEIFHWVDGVVKQLSQVNTPLLSTLQLGHTQELQFTAHDGTSLHGFVTLPPHHQAQQQHPAILLIHGGPVSQFDHSFSFEAQFLAANGYAVVRTNPRGSSGYGEAFSSALWQGWGEKDYRDVIAGIDHAIALGLVDSDRLGVGGYSYGGILTNYILGHSNRFKAAVSGAGSGHYLASYGHDEYRYWYESELGLPWEDRSLWERLSPFNTIHRATTPTLFYGGESDWNVPIQGSEQLYQVMRRVGVETQLVVYPDEHHGGWTFPNERDSMLRTLQWFDAYLK